MAPRIMTFHPAQEDAPYSAQENALADLREATSGFDHVFANELDKAREVFEARETPLHLLGLGALSFLQAALGMESGLMVDATRLLTLAEAGARKQLKVAKTLKHTGRFPAATEWELVHADATILLGMTHALSESYMGYLQCLYAMNNAHSKFNKLYKVVFPAGIEYIRTPSLSRKTSRANGDPRSSAASLPLPVHTLPLKGTKSSFFGRWGSTLTVSQPVSGASTPISADDGPIEELIVSGTAFGHGLFQLVLSLLPAKVKSVVGFFGLQHDRKLALRALAISADRNDVHSVFAGLALMSYHGVVLLMSGYQADEPHIFKQYRAIVNKLEARYPTGTLWILNRAKILRMAGDADGAIAVLRDGLKPGRPSVFIQADALLIFELAWLLLANREYKEAAETFIRMTEINTWSHATYFFLAAGCYWRIGKYAEAERLFDAIPAAIDKRKIGGKDLPTEVFIKKRLAFYKAKQTRLTGSEADYARAITISPAEEMGIFWNNHARIQKQVAEGHIYDWLALTPPVSIQTPYTSSLPNSPPDYPSPPPALDTPDEQALRSLLLGINHRTAGAFAPARAFLLDAHARQGQLTTSTWIGGVAQFELAVLALKEAQAREEEEAESASSRSGESGESERTEVRGGGNRTSGKTREVWRGAIREAGARLEAAAGLAGSEIDLSSRLESRMAMLRDEIGLKKDILGI